MFLCSLVIGLSFVLLVGRQVLGQLSENKRIIIIVVVIVVEVVVIVIIIIQFIIRV